jgi:hypothetical protein
MYRMCSGLLGLVPVTVSGTVNLKVTSRRDLTKMTRALGPRGYLSGPVHTRGRTEQKKRHEEESQRRQAGVVASRKTAAAAKCLVGVPPRRERCYPALTIH